MTHALLPDDLRLLDLLLHAHEARGLHELARLLKLKPAKLTAAVGRLTDLGCRLESHPQHGLRLVEAGLNCWSEYLQWRHSGGPGRRTLVYNQSSSTQDVARQLIRGAADISDFDGTVILADQQTTGRGRLGRSWHSTPGNCILMSLIVSQPAPPLNRQTPSATDSVAIGKTRTRTRPIDSRRFSGGAAIVGIGINVRGSIDQLHPDLRNIAGSLESCSAYIDRLRVIDLLLQQLDHALHHLDDASLADAWRRRAQMAQQRITVKTDGRTLTGRVIDIDPAHGLLMEVEGGPVVTLPAATTSLVL